MAAVAARAASRETAVHRHASTGARSARRTGARRRSRSSFAKFTKLALSMLAFACLFGYVTVYAHLALAGFNRSKLTEDYRAEKLRNDHLNVAWNSLSSPNKVESAARKAGMVYATQYDYIRSSEKTARVAER